MAEQNYDTANWFLGVGTIPSGQHSSSLEGHGGESTSCKDTCNNMKETVFMWCFVPPVPPSPPHFTPVKLEHAEQMELGYMPLRDDFERVCLAYI